MSQYIMKSLRKEFYILLCIALMIPVLLQAATVNLATVSGTAVSTSFVSSWENLSAVNDGYTPTSSTDKTHTVYGNWNGESDYGIYNWVQYEWPFAHKVSSISVYWFTDYGGIAQPTDAYIEYWDGLAWINAGKIGTILNTFNTLTATVSASKVRIKMKSTTSTGIVELRVMGVQTTSCDATPLQMQSKTNQGSYSLSNTANIIPGNSVAFKVISDGNDPNSTNGKCAWTGPNGFSASGMEIQLSTVVQNMSGTYTATYVNDCGTVTKKFFYLTVLPSLAGGSFNWPTYSPTISYNYKQEFPNLTMPTKDLNDCSNVAGTMSSGWWTFKWGPKASKKVTTAAITQMLNKVNTDFAYIRDTMGWPPDKRIKNGYRSAIYLYGSGLCTDTADSTALGGWMGSIDYLGQSWPMVLLSYYPVSCFDPSFTGSDKDYQTNAVVHEGIHALLADLPGCKNAAWFQEGGNTWLQQEMACRRTNNYSSMCFLNAGAYMAPFMPIECYSGWLQDDSFGGPSAEGVNLSNGSQQICTWRTLLGGTQYGNTFPVFLGQVLGKGSIPWIWRYCKSRVLEGIADTLGSDQTRRLIMEYRAKQAVLDMGKWTEAIRSLLNSNFKSSIGAEWQPSMLTPETWIATPYSKTTTNSEGNWVPEYRTTPGWSGANQIPIHVTGDSVVLAFQPLGENMSCQLCYRTANGQIVYSQPVYGGNCVLKIDPTKRPANGVVIAVVCNTNFIYEGEQTRKSHYDYRLKPVYGVISTADIYKQWYNWTSVIADISTSKAYVSLDELNKTASFSTTGFNLTSSISMTAPSGITLSPVYLPATSNGSNVNVTYAGLATSSGYVKLTSGTSSVRIRVRATRNIDSFTPLYSNLQNLIGDTYINDLANFGGWGNREINTDTLYVYGGCKSGKVFGGNGGGSLEKDLTGVMKPNTSYRVRAKIYASGGPFLFGVSGWDASKADTALTINNANLWQTADFRFTTGNQTGAGPALFFRNKGTLNQTGYIDNWEAYEIQSASAVENIFQNKCVAYFSTHKLIVNIELLNICSLTISVYDMQGKLVKEENVTGEAGQNSFALNSDFAKGLYIIKLISNDTSIIKKALN